MRTAIDTGAKRDDLIAAVGHSTVGFIRLRGDDPPVSHGSGTLLKYGRVFGVLTCGHVWEAVRKGDEIGIMCFTVRGRTMQARQFDTGLLDTVCVGEAPWRWSGPDIAFVRLPDNTESYFQSLATVRNLQRQIDQIATGEFNRSKFHAVAGVVDEWTAPGSVSANRKSMRFSAYVSVGPIRRYIQLAPDHDEWIYEPQRLPATDLPNSYAGTSGGGLWRMRVEREESTPKLRTVLVGVAHYETRRGNIVCAGPSSLYRKLFAAIRTKWPDDSPAQT